VQVSGEAGIGKSRLVAEVKTRAAAEDFLVLQGSCFQMDSSYPYAPLLDMLRTSVATFPLAEKPDPVVLEFARLLPELLLFSSSTPPAPLPDPEQEKRRLFAALTRFFKERTSQQPVLLVIEDLHWCDDISLEFLLSLARSSVDLPLLLLMTYRNDEIQPGLQRFHAQLNRARLSQELQLALLTRNNVDAMLRAMFGLSEDEQNSLLDLIYPLTEGNPFFVEEVLTSLVSRGEMVSDDGGWHYRPRPDRRGEHLPVPRSVQEAVQQRTAYLSNEAKRLLSLAAVAGRRFDFAVLQQVLHCDEEQLLMLMKELVSIQFVQEISAEQFVFRHALTQQSVYTELLARERRLLHRMLAEAIEQLYATPPMLDGHLEDLAFHYYEAGVWSKAHEYTQRVGGKALALYAPHAAIDHFTRAMEAEHQLSLSLSPQLYLLRGQAYETLGDFEHALSDYEYALEVTRIAQDRLMEWQCVIALGFLWTGYDYGQAGKWFHLAGELAEMLDDSTLHARSLNRLGNWLVNTGRIQEGLDAHQEALHLFETRQNIRGMAETLDLLGVAYGFYGDTTNAVKSLGRACELFRNLDDPQRLASSLASRALDSAPEKIVTTYSALRTRDEIVQDIQEALRLARQTNSQAGQAFVEFVTTQVLSSFGEFGQALVHAQEALRIATAIEHQQWISAAYYALGQLYLLMLEPDLAISTLDAGLEVARTLGSSFWSGYLTSFLTQAYIFKQEFPRAKATLETIMPREQQPGNVTERQAALIWGELMLAQGEPDIALHIAENLLASVPGNANQQPIPHLLALKGQALIALMRLEEAAEVLEEAKLGAELRQALSILWRIHRLSGQVYHLLKRDDAVRNEWKAAREIITKLAGTIDQLSLRDHFVQAALQTFPSERPLPSRRIADEKCDGLTEREIEVLHYVAQGLTDAQVAERLVISPRTVHSHLNSIYSKLGISSRSAATRYAIEHKLA